MPSPDRGNPLEKHPAVIDVCRSVCNATTAAILSGLEFERVSNLKGGMLDWRDQRFEVER